MDRDQVSRLALETGFPAGSMEKIIRLGRLAGRFAEHPLLSRVLALKGGTALNMFHGSPPRLSVDLDFNYVGALDREAMLQERPEVERAVEAIASELHYRIQRSSDEHAGRKIFLNYANTSQARDRIEIDLNFAHRLPLVPLRLAPMWQPGDLPQPMVQLCGLEEIAAGKICALLDRYKPRDLFDVVGLMETGSAFWSSSPFKKFVVAFTGILDHPLTQYGRARLERVRVADITAELLPMLGGQTEMDRDDLVDRAWGAVEPILALEDSELEFVDRLQTGDLRLDLLFPEGSEWLDLMNKWPPLKWKELNARKFKSSD